MLWIVLAPWMIKQRALRLAIHHKERMQENWEELMPGLHQVDPDLFLELRLLCIGNQ